MEAVFKKDTDVIEQLLELKLKMEKKGERESLDYVLLTETEATRLYHLLDAGYIFEKIGRTLFGKDDIASYVNNLVLFGMTLRVEGFE